MHASRRPLLAANWKANLRWQTALDYCFALRELLPGFYGTEEAALDLVICPPAPYISVLVEPLSDSAICLGAQDVSAQGDGAHTGDYSAAMLSDCGCDFCIVGHSERRALGEGNALLAEKLARLAEAELIPIFCVGEGLEVREAGNAVAHVLAQLEVMLIALAAFEPGQLVLAYEPIWAIGTGRNAQPADAQEMAEAMRAWLSVKLGLEYGEGVLILYGGSVKPDNIAQYFELPDIDGALIGGASLKAEDFAAMAKSCTALL